MCGRFNILTNTREFALLFEVANAPELPPRFNVSPTQSIPIVKLNHGKRDCSLVRWGLVSV